ncbi:uncharacterized protein PODANS_2_7185 [Podospora anserina S mat+]|uniref:Podospora anserina S mat+ genomic DNA chromosome 2, supercontig 2 n=1 Tax=Podospora anserina (strain S / ATCC MYA-4624 / DSM 980 / FGSC 10383) TaxID=515849 RepID=B2B6A3_PODAN|nr:uncharacterized protein PODANS_2_7185 [Podospora anserina S mat+]CAP73328.1 unnamed protein product [Podospora anserina S mat+]CDP25731.1 Putative protein of unknown function [Podospora anserina S mat+]
MIIMKLLLTITGLAALSTATPTSPSTPTGRIKDPWGDLMTILGFYQHPECSHEDPYWYMTTRLGTFLAVMDETEGCQNVPDVWGDVRVIKVERQDRKCKVTVYTNPDCNPASGSGIPIPEETCVPSEPEKTWKSFAIRGCLD